MTPLKMNMELIEKLDQIIVINHDEENTNEFVRFIEQLGEVRYTEGYEGKKRR